MCASQRKRRDPAADLPWFAVRARDLVALPTNGPWAQLACIADHQRGVLVEQDLVAADLSRRQIQHAVATGRLIPLYRGVYALGHMQLRDEGWLLAALKTGGPHTALCADTAAWWWRLTDDSPARIHVATRENRRHTHAIMWHTLRLAAADFETHRGLPVTTVARTLLDIAFERDTEDRVKRLLREAAYKGLLKTEDIPALLRRTRGHRGARRLKDVTEAYLPEMALARSELERRFLDLLIAAGVPTPRLNERAQNITVDALWPHQKLIVELDSWKAHGHRVAFATDRARDRTLTLAGYRVLRFTWREAIHEQQLVARTLHRALG